MKLCKVTFTVSDHEAKFKVFTFQVKETERTYRILESNLSDFTVETVVHKDKIDIVTPLYRNSLPCTSLGWYSWCMEEDVECNKIHLRLVFGHKRRELERSLEKFQDVIIVK